MNINLYKNYYLKSEPLNYTLIEKKQIEKKQVVDEEENDDKEYEKVLGYFTTIEGAIKHMCTEEIRACKCTTLNGLIKEIKVLESMVSDLCDQIGADNLVKNVIKMHKEDNDVLKIGDDDKPKKRRGRPRRCRRPKP